MSKRVLVLGAGLAGMVVALALAEQAVEVFLVDKSPAIGGKSINYCCKATSGCNRCSVCLVAQIKSRVENEYAIKLIVNSKVKSIKGEPGNYQATVHFLSGSRGLDLGAETTLQVEAIVLTVGFDLYNPAAKGEYGYGQHKGVITAYELETALKQHGSIEVAFGSGVKNLGFIQCVGSRDLQAGNDYCSRVCCAYTDRLANLIRFASPEINIDIFYQDLQVVNHNRGYSDTGNPRYLKNIPAKIYRYPYNYLTVRYADGVMGKIYEHRYDLIVLCPAVMPPADLPWLAAETGFGLSGEGFLAGSSRDGVFAAGACTGPKDIPLTIAHARAVAGKVIQFIS